MTSRKLLPLFLLLIGFASIASGADNGKSPPNAPWKSSRAYTPVNSASSTNANNTARDIRRPTISAFNLPASSTSLTVSGIIILASDNVKVTGYYLSTSSTTPSAWAANWRPTPPSSATFPSAGLKTLYAWVKDAAGNISSRRAASTNIIRIAQPTLPSITTHPKSTSLSEGQPLSLSVAVTGTAPFTYQWKKNNINITGATSSTYQIPGVNQANAGTYSVVVSNSAGNVTSNNAVVSVNTLPSSTQKHFGFFWTDATIAPEISGMADIAMSQPTSSDLQTVKNAGLKVVVILNSVFFYLDPSKSNFLQLRSDYSARWSAAAQILARYQSNLFAFYPFDEPFWNAFLYHIPQSQMYSNLQTVASTIKASFPNIPIALIEAYPMINSDLQLPSGFDIFGFDCYDNWELCGTRDVGSSGYVPQSIPTLFNILKDKVRALNAIDGKSRKLAIIPPSSYYVPDAESGTINHSAKESATRNLAAQFVQMALADDMVTVVINFLWNTFREGGGTYRGLQDMSATTKNWYRYFSNLTLGKSSQLTPVAATASHSALPSASPSALLDGNLATAWNAGVFPNAGPVWAQLDLGRNATIAEIRFTVAQTPAGATVHEIWAGPSPESLVKFGTISKYTSDSQVLVFSNPAVLSARSDLRYIRIVTTQSPSWVAWKEIQVNGVFNTYPQ